MIRKVLITGPEATGKSSLCKQLADYHNDLWVQEFAREYLMNTGGEYKVADLDVMLRGQLLAEHEAASQAEKLIFCDTGPENFFVWSRFKYNEVSDFIRKQVSEMSYDLVLLLDVDLPWENDPLRENPSLEERQSILELFEKVLTDHQVDFQLISGQGEARFQLANQIICSH